MITKLNTQSLPSNVSLILTIFVETVKCFLLNPKLLLGYNTLLRLFVWDMSLGMTTLNSRVVVSFQTAAYTYPTLFDDNISCRKVNEMQHK